MGESRRRRWLWLLAAFSLVVPVAAAVPAETASAVAAKWSIVRSPDLAGAGLSSLDGLSCLSTIDCVAVGFGNETSSIGKTLIERWDGTAWKTVPSPNPDNNAALYTVSCASDTACLALGDHGKLGDTPFGERWDGKQWSVVASPMPAGMELALPYSVSCASAARCMAVGYTYSQQDGLFRTFAERWDGTKLSILPTPNGPDGGSFYSVSCTSSKYCVAVGSIAPTPSTRTALIAQWDGAHWSTVKSPNPPGGQRSSLGGVSCASETMCMATGTWARSNDQLAATMTLTERWNGKAWQYVPSPKPVGAGRAGFNGASCPSPTSCMAVGTFVSTPHHTLTSKGFAEQWNGKSWAIAPLPNPIGASDADIASVECPSALNCVAVGGNSTGTQTGDTLAEVYR
jgi:hypothetical protein